jgi:glutamyl-tRNA synthetase
MSFQERYMQATPLDERVALCLPFLERAGWIASPPDEEQRALAKRIVEAAGDRIKVAGDVLDYDEFFTADEALAYDEKAFDRRIRNAEGAAALLEGAKASFAAISAFDPPSLEKNLADFVGEKGLGLGSIVHALRIAVTGKAVGFGLFDILAILGRERVIARIDRALERLQPVN